jgi:hypothetical protein
VRTFNLLGSKLIVPVIFASVLLSAACNQASPARSNEPAGAGDAADARKSTPSKTKTFTKKSDIPGDRMLLGTGFNTATGAERGDCVVRGPVETVAGGPGARTHYKLREITSLEDFRKATNTTAAASFGWGIFSGSGSSEFYSSGRYTKFNNFLLIDVTVLNPMEILSQVRLTPEARSRAAEGGTSFIDACGDEFVDKRQTGGQFTVIAQFGSTTSEQQEQVQQKIKVAVHAFFIGGEGEAAFNESMTSLNTITDTNFEVIRVGASGAVPDLAAVKAYALAFPATVSTDTHQAAAMYVVTRENSTILELPRGARDFSSVSRQRQTLEHYADILDRAYELLGNLTYVSEHPDQFQNVAKPALDEAVKDDRDKIRALKNGAEDCHRSVAACADPTEPKFTDLVVARANTTTTVVPPPTTPPPTPQWVTVDPTGSTLVGTIGWGEFKALDIRGQWNPGPGRPCYPPVGANDDTVFPQLGLHAFGAEYRLLDLETNVQVRGWTSFIDSPIQLPHAVKVEVKMHDTVLGDNKQCTPPMRAVLY